MNRTMIHLVFELNGSNRLLSLLSPLSISSISARMIAVAYDISALLYSGSIFVNCFNPDKALVVHST